MIYFQDHLRLFDTVNLSSTFCITLEDGERHVCSDYVVVIFR